MAAGFGRDSDQSWSCHVCGGKYSRPRTPERGEPMPQTQEYWVKRADMDGELIDAMLKEIISLQKQVRKRERKIYIMKKKGKHSE